MAFTSKAPPFLPDLISPAVLKPIAATAATNRHPANRTFMIDSPGKQNRVNRNIRVLHERMGSTLTLRCLRAGNQRTTLRWWENGIDQTGQYAANDFTVIGSG